MGHHYPLVTNNVHEKNHVEGKSFVIILHTIIACSSYCTNQRTAGILFFHMPS
jgi:hypothetical protein